MNLRAWIVVGAAVVGAAATSLLTPETAWAAAKPATFIKCSADRFVGVKFAAKKTKVSEGPGGNYQPANDTLAIAGGSGKVHGTGKKFYSLIRGMAISATVADLETRTDFPVTVPSIVVSFTQSETKGVPVIGGGTLESKSWLGTNQITMHITSYKTLPTKKGKHWALVKGDFSGTVPVLTGDANPLVVSGGTFAVKIEVL